MVVLEGKKAYTISETAKLMNVIYKTVSHLVSKGKLPYEVISGRKYITEDAIREYSKQQKGKEKA